MAIRTTSTAVGLIIEVDSTISLTSFIEVASSMVDDHLAGTPPAYTSTKLELIERWLSAHFYAIRDQRTASEKAGSVGQSFQFKVDLGLNQTIYGQQVMLIDSSGILAALHDAVSKGGKRTAGITWLGTGDSDGNDTSGV